MPVEAFFAFIEDASLALEPSSGLTWYRPVTRTRDGAIAVGVGEWQAHHPEFAFSSHPVNGLVKTDGLYVLHFEGERFMVATPLAADFGTGHNPILIGGANGNTLVRLLKAYSIWAQRFRCSVRAWGGGDVVWEPNGVAERDVILAPELKKQLLDYVDLFWRYRALAEERGLPHRRGILLAGRPGTGKTQFIRHLFTRFPEAKRHIFAPTGEQFRPGCSFSDMLAALRDENSPAIVVIEDIDLLFASRSITPTYFLNALDGLFTLPSTMLWVATANDPSALELNLLDRPGRFDNVVIFQAPGDAERRALVRLFSRDQIADTSMNACIAASAGLMGAHIREACVTAELKTLDSGGDYAVALLKEFARVQKQHQAAKDYQLSLKPDQVRTGFFV